LDGLSAQSQLVNLDWSGTPLSAEQCFRPTILATVSGRLDTLNGDAVTQAERDGAAQLATDPTVLYLEQNDAGQQHHDPAMLAVYLKEHRRLFSSFALNRAVLIDLKASGPVPVVDATTTEAGIVRATEAMKARNRKLREIIQNTEDELGTGQANVEKLGGSATCQLHQKRFMRRENFFRDLNENSREHFITERGSLPTRIASAEHQKES
jgi:hypothetical protein